MLLRLGTEKEGARFCCGFLLLFLPRGVARGVGRPTSIDLQRNLSSARQNSNRIPVRLLFLYSESVMGLVCCLNRHQADVLGRSDPVDSFAPTLDHLVAYARDRSTSSLHWLVRLSPAFFGVWVCPLALVPISDVFPVSRSVLRRPEPIRIGAAGCLAALGRRSAAGVPVAARPSACARSAGLLRPFPSCRVSLSGEKKLPLVLNHQL